MAEISHSCSQTAFGRRPPPLLLPANNHQRPRFQRLGQCFIPISAQIEHNRSFHRATRRQHPKPPFVPVVHDRWLVQRQMKRDHFGHHQRDMAPESVGQRTGSAQRCHGSCNGCEHHADVELFFRIAPCFTRRSPGGRHSGKSSLKSGWHHMALPDSAYERGTEEVIAKA